MDPITITAAVAAAPALSQGMSPLATALSLGPVFVHVAKPWLAKVPDATKPLLAALGLVGTGALSAMAQGVPWQQALGYGVGTALAGKGYFAALNIAQGVVAAQQVAATK